MNSADAIAVDLANLLTADRVRLSALWSDVHGSDPPKNLSLPFLRQALSYEELCAHQGPLHSRLRRQIRHRGQQLMAAQGSTGPASAPHATPISTLQPGARLMRDWNGKTWVVDVTATGFTMQGHSYKSLTAIARKITGAHWSGPRFFGLKGPSTPRSTPVEREAA